MPKHNAVQKQLSSDELEAEILRAEREVDQDAQRLEAELARAQSEAAELEAALAKMTQRVTEAHAARGDINELTSLSQRLMSAFVPAVDLEGHRERELAVRADGVRARSWVIKSMRSELKRFASDLTYITHLIDEGSEQLDAVQRASRQSELVTHRRQRLVTAEPQLVGAGSGADADPGPGYEDGGAGAAGSEATLQPRPSRDGAAGSSPPSRQQPRVRMEARIDLHSHSNFFNGFSEDISDGGIFISTEHVVAIGTEVDLAFSLPSGIEIRGRGVVRWTRDASECPNSLAGVGVQFQNLSGAAQDAVANFVRSRDPIFYPV